MNNDNVRIPMIDSELPKPGRRRFVGSAMRLPLAFFVPTALAQGPSSTAAVPAYSPEQRLKMVSRMIWLLFPLEVVGTAPYERSVAALLDKLEQDPARLALIDGGLGALDEHADGHWIGSVEADQIAAMRAIESTPFFQYMYGNAQATLFNDEDVWDAIGYGGSALAFGGYTDNLVEDIEWIEGSN